MPTTVPGWKSLEPPAVSQTSAPLLVQNAWLGYGLGLAFTGVFILLTILVTQPDPILKAWDTTTGLAIHDWAKRQPGPIYLFFRFWSAYGREGAILIVVILTVNWARQRKRRLLWMLVFGVPGVELWFQIFHNMIDRPRPEYKDPFESLIGAGYPSGHMATNFVLGWFILYLLLPGLRQPLKRGLITLGVAAVVLIVGFSRLFLGLHYPTDMIGGVVLGLAWGFLVLTFTENYYWRRRKHDPAAGRPPD